MSNPKLKWAPNRICCRGTKTAVASDARMWQQPEQMSSVTCRPAVCVCVKRLHHSGSVTEGHLNTVVILFLKPTSAAFTQEQFKRPKKWIQFSKIKNQNGFRSISGVLRWQHVNTPVCCPNNSFCFWFCFHCLHCQQMFLFREERPQTPVKAKDLELNRIIFACQV